MDEQFDQIEIDEVDSSSSSSDIDEVPGIYVPFTREQMIETAWKFYNERDENGNVIDTLYAAQHAFSWWRDAAELANAPYEEILFAQDQGALAEQIFSNNLLGVQIYEKTSQFS